MAVAVIEPIADVSNVKYPFMVQYLKMQGIGAANVIDDGGYARISVPYSECIMQHIKDVELMDKSVVYMKEFGCLGYKLHIKFSSLSSNALDSYKLCLSESEEDIGAKSIINTIIDNCLKITKIVLIKQAISQAISALYDIDISTLVGRDRDVFGDEDLYSYT